MKRLLFLALIFLLLLSISGLAIPSSNSIDFLLLDDTTRANSATIGNSADGTPWWEDGIADLNNNMIRIPTAASHAGHNFTTIDKYNMLNYTGVIYFNESDSEGIVILVANESHNLDDVHEGVCAYTKISAGEWYIRSQNAPVSGGLGSGYSDAGPHSLKVNIYMNNSDGWFYVDYEADGVDKPAYRAEHNDSCAGIFLANAGAGVGYAWNISVYNGTLYPESGTPPTINFVNFTSEGGQNCTDSTCGPTDDTTPTFKITTDIGAWCRISNTSGSYTSMGVTRNCTDGMGTTSLNCTLKPQDALIPTGIDYVYIACDDGAGSASTKTITMNMAGSSLANDAIEEGILNQLPRATIKTDQRVYIRYANTTQKYGTFDKVALYGSKRWLFNFIISGESFINMYSIGTTVNVWEENNTELTPVQITTAVEAFINSTK